MKSGFSVRFAMMAAAWIGGTVAFGADNLAQSAKPWRVASDSQGGLNLAKICLETENGKWTERDASNQSNCDEIVVINRDTRWIWPDKTFYSTIDRRKRSRLFDNNDGTFASVVVLRPRPSAVLAALGEAGALRRVENETSAGIQSSQARTCNDAYNNSRTFDDLRSARAVCGGTLTPAGVAAQRRVQQISEADKAAQQEAAAARNRPSCSNIRFSGYVVGGSPENVSVLKASIDVSAMLAQNPLRCAPSALTQTYTCRGAARLERHNAYIVSWTDTVYQIATAIDLDLGRKDAMVFIDRNDASCMDHNPPSLNFGENLRNFLMWYSSNR